MSRDNTRLKRSPSRRIEDLGVLLAQLRKLHEELLAVILQKITALKKADMPAMRESTVREHETVRVIQQQEGLRRQLMEALAEELQLPARAARTLSVSQLAERIGEPFGDVIQNEAMALRDVMAKVASANRIAGTIARRVVEHMQNVFASVRPKDEKITGYSGAGTLVGPNAACAFEAVG